MLNVKIEPENEICWCHSDKVFNELLPISRGTWLGAYTKDTWTRGLSRIIITCVYNNIRIIISVYANTHTLWINGDITQRINGIKYEILNTDTISMEWLFEDDKILQLVKQCYPIIFQYYKICYLETSHWDSEYIEKYHEERKKLRYNRIYGNKK